MGIHFVIPPAFAQEVAALSERKLGEDYPYWLGGRFNWVAQTWLVLREHREGLTIGTEPMADRINFGHVMGWRAIGARRGEFRVSVRADYKRMYDVDFEILQNPEAPLAANQAYLPYWPVPGVIPRDPSRHGLRTLAYAGRIGPLNLAEDLKSGFAEQFQDLEFRIIPPHLWHDLSGIDALIAIRSLNTSRHLTKPPSKLFSAWRADIPLIAGYDAAFSAVGTPGEDYLRVSSIDELREGLTRLKDDPAFYESIVNMGRLRAPEVGHDTLAEIWLQLFDTQIANSFDYWKDRRLKGMHSLIAQGADYSRETASRIRRTLRKG